MDKYERLSPAVLRQLLKYDPSTGAVTWRYREAARPEWNTKYAGKLATTQAKGGYLCIGLKVAGKKANYLCHRIAFAYVFDKWPATEFQVDRINGIRTDNRLENLRVVTSAENHMNTHRVKSPHGYKGVCKPAHTKRFRATIRHEGRNRYLGYYATPEEAARAYDAAAVTTFGEHARTNASLGLLRAERDA